MQFLMQRFRAAHSRFAKQIHIQQETNLSSPDLLSVFAQPVEAKLDDRKTMRKLIFNSADKRWIERMAGAG